jgi:uncharacterized membrane protein
MEKWIGGVLGVLAAAVIIGVGLIQGVPAGETFWRAALGGIVGFLLGWLVFGKLGAAVMREAAGRDAERDDHDRQS